MIEQRQRREIDPHRTRAFWGWHTLGRKAQCEQSTFRLTAILETSKSIGATPSRLPAHHCWAHLGPINECNHPQRGRPPIVPKRRRHGIADQCGRDPRTFIAKRRTDPRTSPSVTHIFSLRSARHPKCPATFAQKNEAAAGRHELCCPRLLAIVMPISKRLSKRVRAMAQAPDQVMTRPFQRSTHPTKPGAGTQ